MGWIVFLLFLLTTLIVTVVNEVARRANKPGLLITEDAQRAYAAEARRTQYLADHPEYVAAIALLAATPPCPTCGVRETETFAVAQQFIRDGICRFCGGKR